MKKIIALVLVLVLALTAIGGTLAYFTDNENATNSFTVGSVDIVLHESEDSQILDDFQQYKQLMPGTSKVNNVQKHVIVENTGINDAWVWVDMLIPAALVSDQVLTGNYNATYDSLHTNSYGEFNVEWHGKGYTATPIADRYIDAEGNVLNSKMVSVDEGLWYEFVPIEKQTIEGVDYILFRSKMEKTLPAGKLSLPALKQVYLDWRVTADEGGIYLIDNAGNPQTTYYTGDYEVLIKAYAMQADGIANVDAAIAAYYDPSNPVHLS